VDGTLADILAWLQPRALMLAVVLPPVIRILGHFVPEELFMVAMGVLASRSDSPQAAATLLFAVFLSQGATDQLVYLVGRWLRPRLDQWPRLEKRLSVVTSRLSSSPTALAFVIPGRVLPLGRAAWLASCGIIKVPWPKFLLIDATALTLHVLCWSGLGWWLASDIQRLEATVSVGKFFGATIFLTLLTAIGGWYAWQRRTAWQPVTVKVARRTWDSIRQIGRGQ
jgi:membrane protein DedA with SNARE-associated domain